MSSAISLHKCPYCGSAEPDEDLIFHGYNCEYKGKIICRICLQWTPKGADHISACPKAHIGIMCMRCGDTVTRLDDHIKNACRGVKNRKTSN